MNGGSKASRPRSSGYPTAHMRVRNKEIKARRKRKEETIKAAEKATREQYANKPAAKKPAPKK